MAELLFCMLYWKGREIGLCDTHILFPGLDYVNSKGEGLGDHVSVLPQPCPKCTVTLKEAVIIMASGSTRNQLVLAAT